MSKCNTINLKDNFLGVIMAKTVDYYKLLGISIFAGEKEIRTAYLHKIKQYHPDTYKGNKREAENITAELNLAYDTLKDKDKKYVYDVKFGFDRQRDAYLREEARKQKIEAKKRAKQERKKKSVNTGDYAPEKKAKEKTEKQEEFNKDTQREEKKIKTNFFTKQPKKDVKSVHHKVLTSEEKSSRRDRLILDFVIIGLLLIIILLIIFH